MRIRLARRRIVVALAILAVVGGVHNAPIAVGAAAELPQSPRPFLAPGESLADAHYILRFGRHKEGNDSLAETGMKDHVGQSRRLFDNPAPDETGTQKSGMYDIAYKTRCCTEHVSSHLRNRVPPNGSYLNDFSFFDSTALWLGHSQFKPGSAPPVGSESPPAEGIRDDGTRGPADTGAAVRVDDEHLVPVPVVPNAETKRSFLISTNVHAPRHPGARYQLRPQPYLDRGGRGLTGPGGLGNRTIDLGPATDRFAVLQIRADIVTHGGSRVDTSDDTGRVTYRYFLDNVEVGTPDTFEMSPSALQTGQGDVRFGPGFALLRGWQGDAPEVFVDNIAVYDIQAVPFRTSWIGETILPTDAAKYAVDNHPYYERHVAQNLHALWTESTPLPDGKTLIYANSHFDEAGRSMGIYSYEIVDGRGVIRPYSRLGGTYLRSLGGLAVTGDSEYVYASYQKVGASCVAQHDKRKIAPDISVPTVGTDLCLPDPPSAETHPQNIRGLAASADHLFLSHRQLNEVRVYRKDQLTTPVHTVSVPNPRGMAYGSNGRLWVIVNGQPSYVQEYVVGPDGGLTPGRRLAGPRPGIAAFEPSAVVVDKAGLLHVTNDAREAQQIQVFDTTKSELPEVVSKRLGDAGGVMAFGGEYGPARFDGPTGVAVDNAGNYYVASNGVGASTAKPPAVLDIRRFNGASKALEAQVQNYLSTAVVAPDPAAPGVVYSPVHRYALNLDSQVPGTEWSPDRTTLMTDRYRCQDDPRVSGVHQQAAIAVRYMGPERKKFLFATGQGDVGRLGVYKFSDDGKRSQPSVFFSEQTDGANWPPNKPTSPLWSWRDKDGDCQFDANEYDKQMDLRILSNWSVSEQDTAHHRAGDLWMAGQNGVSQWQLKRVRFDGTFEGGSPKYDTNNVEAMPLPQPFLSVHGLVYQSATDTLYLMGQSVNDPTMRTGWQIARYDKFYERHLAQKAGTGPGPSPTWLQELPADVAKFCPNDPHILCRPFTLTAAGDRVYVGNAKGTTPTLTGRIRMYDAATGTRLGSLVPGPEVAHRSGFHDMRHAVTAMQLPDGRRYVFAEENWYSRVLMYKGF
ncbi:hypothetical protein EV193_102210 [Herbihabitans rhizosphaerae]|uniref:NHL repeat-containing protein n=1 Tax=Herbihabitans rhizosphaerae TaxID=1872711 RepID=A0A4Q7L428_9PSEU|nr:hypothetical protein [Herbihabitans rhizosphaerae]RZS43231.1 hypothetical protein EV193_102210 [Herbihabitans rhizosphaerae]